MPSEYPEPVLARRCINRRGFLATGLAAGGTGAAVASHWFFRNRQPRSHVLIRRAVSYREPFEAIIRDALREYPAAVAQARAGTVVLKPNLVEYRPARALNTHPAVVAGAIAAFRSLGAAKIVVAEGPAHCRDTEMLIEASGLGEVLSTEGVEFVDLNLDSTRPVPLLRNYTNLNHIHFPVTVLDAALVVSVAKLKTHHWAGVTLSMKNMFGTVPGVRYGWPKNVLHWRGIDNAIADINLAVKPGFAIIDGIEGMEGDGPLNGETVEAGALIMGDNLTAVDATASRIMGLFPERVRHITMMLPDGGTIHEGRIEQRGESIAHLRRDFRVIDLHSGLKKPNLVTDYFRGL